jgi:hypothetical protein
VFRHRVEETAAGHAGHYGERRILIHTTAVNSAEMGAAA